MAFGELVIAGGETPGLLETTKEAFNDVAVPQACPSVEDSEICNGLRRRRESGFQERTGWKTPTRLHQRYARLTVRGKSKQHAVIAVARELLGLVWAIGVEVEGNQQTKEQQRAA